VVRICPPKLHALLDVVVALCLALAPIVPVLRPDVTGILLAEFAAVGWLRVTTLTRYSVRARHAPEPDAPAQRQSAAPRQPAQAQSVIDAGARRLGRGTARARRAWRAHR
jgi:hypothetical protein